MATTYTPIATATASGAVTFSSIPSTYTDLILIVKNSSASTGVNNTIRVNSDTGTNYSTTQVYGSGGGSPGSSRVTSGSNSWGGIAGADSISIIQFMNYANTTTYKTWIGRGSGPNNYITIDVNLWRNTAAINSIYIDSGAAAGSTFTLYGIKAA